MLMESLKLKPCCRIMLATNLPLFSRLHQLPIPLGMDLLLTPGEHVLRRDVAEAVSSGSGPRSIIFESVSPSMYSITR